MRISFENISSQLGNFIKLENAPSKNGYNKAPNQFIFHFTNGKVFQSYETIVAAYVGNQLYLSPEHDCSSTTNRIFVERNGKEISYCEAYVDEKGTLRFTKTKRLN